MRVKRESIPIPANEIEAIQAVSEIGKLQRRIEAIQINLNDRIEQAKAAAIEHLTEPQEQLQVILDGLFIFCQNNRATLTPKGKTKHWPSGDISWRLTPPRVGLKNQAAVLAALRKSRLFRFIRKREEIDKEAILRDRKKVAGIPGITISQCEEFVVKPAEVTCEITKSRKL